MQKIVLGFPPAVGESVILVKWAKIYTDEGYEVYADASSGLKKNTEAWDLIVERNPYILDQKKEESTDIFHGVRIVPRVKRYWDTPRLISMTDVPIEDRKSKIYYTPKLDPRFDGAPLIDLHISDYRRGTHETFDGVPDAIEEYTGCPSVRMCNAKKRTQKGFHLYMPRKEDVVIKSLTELCDAYYSAAKVILFQTGSRYIARAFNRNTVLLLTDRYIRDTWRPDPEIVDLGKWDGGLGWLEDRPSPYRIGGSITFPEK